MYSDFSSESREFNCIYSICFILLSWEVTAFSKQRILITVNSIEENLEEMFVENFYTFISKCIKMQRRDSSDKNIHFTYIYSPTNKFRDWP